MKTPFASKHEVSIEPKNKNKQRKIFRDAIMFSFFLREGVGWRTVHPIITSCYRLQMLLVGLPRYLSMPGQ